MTIAVKKRREEIEEEEEEEEKKKKKKKKKKKEMVSDFQYLSFVSSDQPNYTWFIRHSSLRFPYS